MQHTTGVAVVATQLADTDRRALSQAWYSALHVAERMPSVRPLAPAPAPMHRRGGGGARRTFDAAQHGCAGAAQRTAAAREAAARRPGEAGILERRAPKPDLARCLERKLVRRFERRATASFAVAGAGGRVQVVVRNDGGRTRIIAVCALPLRERVERALAHARFALAGRGVRVEAA